MPDVFEFTLRQSLPLGAAKVVDLGLEQPGLTSHHELFAADEVVGVEYLCGEALAAWVAHRLLNAQCVESRQENVHRSLAGKAFAGVPVGEGAAPEENEGVGHACAAGATGAGL